MTDDDQLSTAKKLLDNLSDLEAHKDIVKADYLERRKATIPPDVWENLEELEADEKSTLESLDKAIEDTKTQIRYVVAALGTTIKSQDYLAVCTRPRIKWNADALEVYAVSNPDVLNCRTVSEPTVTIRRA